MVKEIDEKTFVSDIEEEINEALGPFRALISIAEDLGEDMFDFHEMMEIVLEKVKGNITKFLEFVENNLGVIKVQGVKSGEFLDFEGKRYGSLSSPKLFRAFLIPVEKPKSTEETAA
jgi:hypothetical protein